MQILELLAGRGARVTYHDPLVPEFHLGSQRVVGTLLDDAALAEADCVVIATNHSSFDWERVVQTATLVVDTRNATAKLPSGLETRARILRLGTALEGQL
jgi:UDP-N-acetyl-D-glucosamine dehydrogenase